MTTTMLGRAGRRLLAILCALVATPSLSATVPLPQCMSYTGSYMPCGGVVPIDPATGNPIAQGALPPASSTPLDADVTASGVTATSGGSSFASGAATLGPFVPQLGRDLRVVIRPTSNGGSWAGSVAIGTSSAANACAAGTIYPLTVAGSTWGSFVGNANEVVDTPTVDGSVYCATVTVSSGSAHVVVRQ